MNTLHSTLALALFALFALGSCVTPAQEVHESAPTSPEPSPTLEAAPWTDHFVPPAVLVADEVTITGPTGLLEHVASRIDPHFHTQKVETVPAGLQQTYRLKVPNAPVDISAWLDGLQIAAIQQLVICEQPSATHVRVVGRGDAYWGRVDGPERREDEIVLEAPVPNAR